jgi:hypothetical protein
MKIGGAFRDFARRVLDAAGRGGLPKIEQKKLDHLLSRTGMRNTILAKGILTALDAGGATKADIAKLSGLLAAANERILADKAPFTTKDRTELTDIFRRAYIPRKTTGWFSSHIDELLAEQIKDEITAGRALGVPKKLKA